MKLRLSGIGLTLAALAGALLLACGGGSAKGEVAVELREWSVTPSMEEHKTAELTFNVTNRGSEPHELLVIKTDGLPTDLPLTAAGAVDEAKVELKGEIEPFAAGSTQTLTLKLAPGKYVLICNLTEQPPGQAIVSHYQNGMYASLVIDK